MPHGIYNTPNPENIPPFAVLNRNYPTALKTNEHLWIPSPPALQMCSGFGQHNQQSDTAHLPPPLLHAMPSPENFRPLQPFLSEEPSLHICVSHFYTTIISYPGKLLLRHSLLLLSLQSLLRGNHVPLYTCFFLSIPHSTNKRQTPFWQSEQHRHFRFPQPLQLR